jgi:hypothetical protein
MSSQIQISLTLKISDFMGCPNELKENPLRGALNLTRPLPKIEGPAAGSNSGASSAIPTSVLRKGIQVDIQLHSTVVDPRVGVVRTVVNCSEQAHRLESDSGDSGNARDRQGPSLELRGPRGV